MAPEENSDKEGRDGMNRRERGVFRANLLRWFEKHRRELPWRRQRTPYRVWVAETMLQQTRVDQVAPYFRRFMKAFPSLRSLAGASQSQVLKVWEGLGYYGRARNLHETARRIVNERHGRFPRTYEGWLDLPGVGPYTAAAVGSFAFDLDVAAVDGNVARVLARVFACPVDIGSPPVRKQLQRWADELLPPGQSAAFNEAMMELGAVVCLPRKPACAVCPVRAVCAGYRGGNPTAFPVKRKRGPVPHKVLGAGVVVRKNGDVLIARRREHGLLGGLWAFPGGTLENGESVRQCIARELKEALGIRVAVHGHLVTVRHAYSHFTMEMHTHWGRIRSGRPCPLACAEWAWSPVAQLRRHPFAKADLTVVAELERLAGRPDRKP